MILSHGGSEHRSLYPQVEEEEPRGPTVMIYCEANPNFFMAVHSQLAVLSLGTPNDPHQVTSFCNLKIFSGNVLLIYLNLNVALF